MPIPDYQTLMLPFLTFLADGKEHTKGEVIEVLTARFQLSPDEQSQLLPSGKQPLFQNRVGWARTYLTKAGLVEATRRGAYRITAAGQTVLKKKPPTIDVRFLKQFPEFLNFIESSKKEANDTSELNVETTPEEQIETGFQKIRRNLNEELQQQVQQCSPAFFERLVIDVLLKMGYGGSLKDAGEAIGRAGDEGIDGIIKEDRLGLDTIYIQAKRWKATIGRPDIQKFVGALQGQRARKGIFITTSEFSDEAIRYVQSIDSKVVLLDGSQLAQFMIDLNVGVSTTASYEIKKLNKDYFEEEI